MRILNYDSDLIEKIDCELLLDQNDDWYMNSVMSCETHCCCKTVKYKKLEFDKFSGLIVPVHIRI